MKRRKAIILSDNGRNEVRCCNCGKLLFCVEKNSENDVDKTAQNIIIVSRCTRSGCKVDNYAVIR